MLVADGVGGDAFGEVASRLVLQSLWELTSLATSWSMKFVDFQTQEFQERIHAYVDHIDQQLKRAAHAIAGPISCRLAALPVPVPGIPRSDRRGLRRRRDRDRESS